jgi:hypothetical protein
MTDSERTAMFQSQLVHAVELLREYIPVCSCRSCRICHDRRWMNQCEEDYADYMNAIAQGFDERVRDAIRQMQTCHGAG